ncbi:hypothetical protein PH210_23895 [Paenibacillus sp. BSR1-1]|uniref:hypothetical protein n=1 Tax=Paenibacillus sp. BSR1-1 TaxID=3020845 RepID=UPI0025B22E7F|nr:hypothetical protein [Paenibacillus sp. BSR1-1]MDN3019218.1 hypothetical protein [Paenibacillus sp. BSR1-1]
MKKTIFNDLKEMVEPYDKNQPYYRSFNRKSNPATTDIFIVCINPATLIYENNIEIDAYVNLLMKYDDFYDFYQKVRGKNGKTNISRTRMGIVGFVNELKHYVLWKKWREF